MTYARSLQLERGYQRMRRETADLHLLLACPSAHPTWLRRLRQEVQLFHEDLTERFSLLDADGFLQEAEAQAPQLHERIRQLHTEQEDLLGQLDRLVESLAGARVDDVAALCRQLGDFLNRLHLHETGKNQLVLEAFTVEPGAMD